MLWFVFIFSLSEAVGNGGSSNGGGTLRRVPPEIVANEIITKPHARIISPSKTVTSPHKILAKDMEDLIHLDILTEDAVMRTLQARFNEKKYFVSTKTVFFLLLFSKRESGNCNYWVVLFLVCFVCSIRICLNFYKKKQKFSFTHFGIHAKVIRFWQFNSKCLRCNYEKKNDYAPQNKSNSHSFNGDIIAANKQTHKSIQSIHKI